MLANIYLHYMIDLWADQWRRREAKGDVIIVRYADDMVFGFQHETEARRFLDAMRQRLEKFALSLHPDKTRLIEFGRYAAERRKRKGLGKQETFTFLGFTFICGKTDKGELQIWRTTSRDRMRAKLKEIKRSQRDRTTWEKMGRIAADYLPCPHVLHPWSNQSFAVKHPRWEPCAGGCSVMGIPTAIEMAAKP